MLHKEAGEPLTHSVLLFLHSFIPPRFNSIDCHQHLHSLSFWLQCWPNQSGNIRRDTQIMQLWPFQILDDIVLLCIWFIVCHTIIFAVIWLIHFAIPVWPILSVRNAFRCAILITFDWIMVDSPDSADIYDLSSSSREVLCRQSWWQRWSFWQLNCSCAIMLEEWPGCLDDLLRIWNVLYGGHLPVLSTKFLLCST